MEKPRGFRERPLLSIVIPTRNRQKYLLSTVASILEITSDDFEIIIHDNSDTDSLKGLITQDCLDPRIDYH